jgi:uncharacterized membrane protein
MRRLAAALGLGLVFEFLVIFVYFHLEPGAVRFSGVFVLTQEPALHLVEWWVHVTQPGYEDRIRYLFLIPFIQWLVYAAVIYPVLRWKHHLWKSD